MTEQDDPDQEEDAPEECRHLYVSEYDGEGAWSSYRGRYCAWCGEPAPDDDGEP